MFVQAIVTRFAGPTNTRGSRIIAKASAGSVTVSYDHGLSQNANHTKAAHALARKYGWMGHYVGGGMPGGNGNAYVCVSQALGEAAFITADAFLIATDPVTGEAVPVA